MSRLAVALQRLSVCRSTGLLCLRLVAMLFGYACIRNLHFLLGILFLEMLSYQWFVWLHFSSVYVWILKQFFFLLVVSFLVFAFWHTIKLNFVFASIQSLARRETKRVEARHVCSTKFTLENHLSSIQQIYAKYDITFEL